MKPANPKASADAWILLACSIDDDAVNKRLSGAIQNTDNPKRVACSMTGEGFDPADSSGRLTEVGAMYLRRTYVADLGIAPYEARERAFRRRKLL